MRGDSTWNKKHRMKRERDYKRNCRELVLREPITPTFVQASTRMHHLRAAVNCECLYMTGVDPARMTELVERELRGKLVDMVEEFVTIQQRGDVWIADIMVGKAPEY